MKILEVYAEEYGLFSHRTFDFSEGFNLIVGPNESGKSTLLSLIKFLFYGFPRRGAGVAEREMRLSRKLKMAAGAMLLEKEGVRYRLSRRFLLREAGGKSTPFEEVTCMEQETGKTVTFEGETPGEHFTGLPEELFLSSLCVRQSELSEVSGKDMSEALGELLFSSEGEGGGAADAVAVLEKARKELQHARGRGGMIPDLEDRIGALDREILAAKESAVRLTEVKGEEKRHRAFTEEKQKEYEQNEECLSYLALREELSLYDAYHREEEEEETLLKEWEEVKGEKERIPDDDTVSHMKKLLKEAENTQHVAAFYEDELRRMERIPRADANVAAVNETVSKMGGVPAAEAAVERCFKREKRFQLAGSVCFFFSLLAMGLTFLFEKMEMPLYIFAAVALFLSFILLIPAVSAWKKGKALLLSLHAPHRKNLHLHLEECRKKGEAAAEIEETLTTAKAELDAARGKFQNILDSVGELLTPWGAERAPATVEEGEKALAAMEKRREKYSEKLGEARMKYERAESARRTLAERIDFEKEPLLREEASHLSVPAEGKAQLLRRRDFLREGLSSMEAKRLELEKTEAALSATAKNPRDLLAEREKAEKELSAAKEKLEAVLLAKEVLTEAEGKLKNGVTPALSKEASAIFKQVTGGKYDGLRVGADMVPVPATEEVVPFSHFSAGCRDAAHLSLRLALLKTVSEEPLPLLLDESLARLDDGRAAETLRFLLQFSRAGGQCLLFTCHGREPRFLEGEKGVQVLSLA